MKGETVHAGDVIQVAPDARVHAALRGLLAIVAEVRACGVIASVHAPEGIYAMRLEHGGFKRIGRAAWQPEVTYDEEG